jgi:Ser/Thr protein kinase RdoA (MazF antagonist)
LKAHAAGADPSRLEHIVHRWMIAARAAGLTFVPHVEPTTDGRTVVVAAGRAWDVTGWMPGTADFGARPTDARLIAAVEALARLHEVWNRVELSRAQPCPAVDRRRAALRSWTSLVDSGWRPRPTADDPVGPHVAVVWERLPSLVARALADLAPWGSVPVPVQPCLCDVWHDHVLFSDDRVTGLIDYGAARVDHVAVDLTRLLGSLVPGQPERTALALSAYRTIRPLPHPDLVDVLDRTSVVVAVTNWLRWLYHDGREYVDRVAVAARVGELVQQI